MLHHRLDGPSDAPLLVLGPAMGTTLDLWEPQLPAFSAFWRVLRFDLPGHGGSPSRPGVTLDELADEVLELAGPGRFAYAGISVGGQIGIALAAAAPERIDRLALLCTAARIGTTEGWLDRAAQVRKDGMGPLSDTAPSRWFTPDFQAHAPFAEIMRGVDAEGYAAMCEAIAYFDGRDRLGRITAPTLVISGAGDPTTPPADGQALADGIPSAELEVLQNASHLANVEQAPAVTRLLTGHLLPDRRGGGTRVRRAVLGDAHVDQAAAGTTDFTADFQDLITRYAWGDIWTRPGLDRKARSCITITALVARGHLDELAMHVRAALRNGLTPEEIKEVLLQSAIYCGVPAANSAFAVAQRVLAES